MHARLAISLCLVLAACAPCGDENLSPEIVSLAGDPDHLDFGTVPAGITATREIHVANIGQSALHIRAEVVEGTAFHVVSEESEVVLAAAQETTFWIRFAPDGQGPFEGTLEIVPDRGDVEILVVPLIGAGEADEVCGDCDAPPPPDCIGERAILVWDEVGECEDGVCRYTAREVPCEGICVPDPPRCEEDEEEEEPEPPPPHDDDDCLAEGEIVRVSTSSRDDTSPSLAFDGEHYALAWFHAEGFSEFDAAFARVDAEGGLVAGPVPVTDWGLVAHPPVLASSGAMFGLAWSDRSLGGNRTAFMRVDGGGEVQAGDLIVADRGFAFGVSVAWNPDDATFAVFSVDHRDVPSEGGEIYMARFGEDGERVGDDARITTLPSRKEYPRAAWNGEHWGIVWYDDRDGSLDVYFVRADAEGTAVGSPVRLTGDATAATRPRIVWADGEWGVAWTDRRLGTDDVYFARLEVGGEKIGDDTAIAPVAGHARSVDLVWTGERYGVTWADHNTGTPRIHFTELDAAGAVLYSPRVLAGTASRANVPAIDWDGICYAIAFGDDRHGTPEIMLRGVAPLGP